MNQLRMKARSKNFNISRRSSGFNCSSESCEVFEHLKLKKKNIHVSSAASERELMAVWSY